MTEEDLEEILDPSGRTAICYALDIPPVYSGEIVKCLVEKNKKLLSIIDPSTKMIPLVMAHGFKWHRHVAKYLYDVTPHETLNVHQAAQIISQGFINKRFDISWDLIQRYPSLAITKDLSGKYPLNRLAESMKWKHLFLSESGLNFLEQWIYDCNYSAPLFSPHIRLLSSTHLIYHKFFDLIYLDTDMVIPPTPTITDISSINVHDPENNECNQKRLIHSGMFT
ncbi:hypothetical protein RchiOBHm_Chr2g0162701 [Rosa chinensis]|uniref:Uncharacterized protein n=1 Tax=Rosa chinensis TaxID=74649 RepID=A0A2P6S337_ROSCH|nr:hypothetical protein RchiOBHm_Chr2g0162701 [Rosa chinensis]